MVSCRDVIEQLWDYLDGELPSERMEELAAHLAECARCYPQYRFEFAFLEALARQRDRLPSPPQALVGRVRLLIST
ncbi:MAG: anti-sigma factor family protein [Gemmatimonadales bacterium]